MSRVFWEAVGYDEQGNAIIKVFNAAEQVRMAQLVEEAEKRSKKAEKPLVELTAAGAFDAMVDSLLNTEAVYIVPGKDTGKNLRIDYTKLDKKESTGNTKDSTPRAPREKQVLVLTTVGEGAW